MALARKEDLSREGYFRRLKKKKEDQLGVIPSETRELIDRLAIFVTDIEKMQKARRQMVAILEKVVPSGKVPSDAEKKKLGALFHNGEIKEGLEVIISNLKSILESANEGLPSIRAVDKVDQNLRIELSGFITVETALFVKQEGMFSEITNFKQALAEIEVALIREPDLLKRVEGIVDELVQGVKKRQKDVSNA